VTDYKAVQGVLRGVGGGRAAVRATPVIQDCILPPPLPDHDLYMQQRSLLARLVQLCMSGQAVGIVSVPAGDTRRNIAR
jgi:hypothetical protein